MGGGWGAVGGAVGRRRQACEGRAVRTSCGCTSACEPWAAPAAPSDAACTREREAVSRLGDGWRAAGEGRWAADGARYARHAGGHRAGTIRAVPGTVAAIVNSRSAPFGGVGGEGGGWGRLGGGWGRLGGGGQRRPAREGRAVRASCGCTSACAPRAAVPAAPSGADACTRELEVVSRFAGGWRAAGEGRWAADGARWAGHAGGHRAGTIHAPSPVPWPLS